MSPDLLSVILRALSFMALLQAAGIAIFMALFRQHLLNATPRVRRVGVWSAVIAALLLVGQFLLEAARMSGDFGGVLDPTLQRIALTSPVAATLAVRLAGVGCIIAGLSRIGAMPSALGFGGAALVAISFSLMGHTITSDSRVFAATIVIVHVFIAAFWFGALPALFLAAAHEAPERSGRVIAAFSAIASWLVPLLAVAGISMALVLVRHLDVFLRPYGWLLMLKMAGFLLLLALAAINRLSLGPAVALGSARAFKRALTAEYALIVAVLAATAIMTSFFSPEH